MVHFRSLKDFLEMVGWIFLTFPTHILLDITVLQFDRKKSQCFFIHFFSQQQKIQGQWYAKLILMVNNTYCDLKM